MTEQKHGDRNVRAHILIGEREHTKNKLSLLKPHSLPTVAHLLFHKATPPNPSQTVPLPGEHEPIGIVLIQSTT